MVSLRILVLLSDILTRGTTTPSMRDHIEVLAILRCPGGHHTDDSSFTGRSLIVSHRHVLSMVGVDAILLVAQAKLVFVAA